MKKIKSIFVLALAMLAISVSFISCEKEEIVTLQYTAEFKYYTPNEKEDVSEKELIENSFYNAFRSELEVTSIPFTLTGTQSGCDKKVFNACKKAVDMIKEIKGVTDDTQITFNARFKYEVKNDIDENPVFFLSFT